MIHSLHLDSFYLTDDQLENSPSRQDGIDKDTEANLRMYGCEVIQEAGIMLSFDQVVMATGQVLLHRFYCKRSMKTFNVKKVAATALWVAAKLEEVREVREHPRKLIEMVMVTVDRCITRREAPEGRKPTVLDSHSKEGEEFRRALIRYESEMLKAFGFVMNVEHPHRLLCNYCQIMFTPYISNEDKAPFVQNFIQQAWNVANDSLRTTLCVRFKGSVVACGIIFYTARKLQVPLPEDWWELFLVKLEDMCDVCRILHELYFTPKPQFVPVCHQLLPSKPPTPAIGAGAAKGAAVTATPTPMLGATPELNTRPGGKPLDPSIRRTIQASESTPNPAAAGAAAGASDGAAGSALASPEGAAAPGSARKRSRSRSPLPSPGDSRKRQQLDSKEAGMPPLGARQKEQQLQQQAIAAMPGAGTQLSRPRSAAGDRDHERDRDRDRDHSRQGDRGVGRSSHRDRPRSRSRDKRKRSRSRDRSRRSRSRSRDHKGGYSRDKSRRSRSRDRKRSHSHSRDRRRSKSRSPDRRRDYRDSKGRSNLDRPDRNRSERSSRDEKGRELKSPAKSQPQEQQQEESFKFPLPPAGQVPAPPAEEEFSAPPAEAPIAANPEQQAQQAARKPAEGEHKGASSTAANSTAGDSKEQQRVSKANGMGSGCSSLHLVAATAAHLQEPQQGKSAAASAERPLPAAAAGKGSLPAVQPKPKPKAVRKLQPAGAAASPVNSPTHEEGQVAGGTAPGNAD